MDGSRPRRGAHERRVAAANWFSSRRPAHRGQPDSPGGHRDVRGLSITRKVARPRSRSCVGAGRTDATVWAAWGRQRGVRHLRHAPRQLAAAQRPTPKAMHDENRPLGLAEPPRGSRGPPAQLLPADLRGGTPAQLLPANLHGGVPQGEKDPRSNGAPDQLVERRAIGTVSCCKNPGYGRVPAVGGGPALMLTAVSPIPPHPADLGSPLRRRWASKSVHNSRRCTIPS